VATRRRRRVATRRELTAEREGAQAAFERARTHAQQVGQGALPDDIEQTLFEHLAALKKAVSDGVDAAPGLRPLRNVPGDLFESVQLHRSDASVVQVSARMESDGFVPFDDELEVVSGVENGEDRYWLLLTLRWASVDADTFKPIGQAMPVPWAGQYPPGFLARYCWW
jgi:hypothetical protein